MSVSLTFLACSKYLMLLLLITLKQLTAKDGYSYRSEKNFHMSLE